MNIKDHSSIQVRRRHIIQERRHRRPQCPPRGLMVIAAPRLEYIASGGYPLEKSSWYHAVSEILYMVLDGVIAFLEQIDNGGTG